jgi:hypothetical protein
MGTACGTSNVTVFISTPCLGAIMVNINSEFSRVAGSRSSDGARWARILTAMNINDVAISEIVPYQPVSYLLQSASGKPRTDYPIAFFEATME